MISARMIMTIITPQEFKNVAFHSSCCVSCSIRLLGENTILIIGDDFKRSGYIIYGICQKEKRSDIPLDTFMTFAIGTDI